MNSKKPDVMIVGTGALGTALAKALAEKNYPITAIVSRRRERAEQLSDEAGSSFALSLFDRIPVAAQLTFLCVPDDAITATARLLSTPPSWQKRIVAHTSGALTASALHPLAQQGAFTMSFHPVQTFSNEAKTPFSGIYIGIEGDTEAIAMGKSVVHNLGARHLVLTADLKPRYHLAASMASNFFVTLISMASGVLESMGMDKEEAIALLRPLVTQTCINVTSSTPEQVLTGPAVRGDEKTLQMHVETIQRHLPTYESFYKTLLNETLELAVNSGRLSPENSETIKNNLDSIR